jgi:heme exporter protein D
MGGITVIVVPTWFVWIIVGIAVAKIAQNCWHSMRLRRMDRAASDRERG